MIDEYIDEYCLCLGYMMYLGLKIGELFEF